MSDLDLSQRAIRASQSQGHSAGLSLTLVEGATAHSIAKVKAIPNNNHTPSRIACSIATVSPLV